MKPEASTKLIILKKLWLSTNNSFRFTLNNSTRTTGITKGTFFGHSNALRKLWRLMSRLFNVTPIVLYLIMARALHSGNSIVMKKLLPFLSRLSKLSRSTPSILLLIPTILLVIPHDQIADPITVTGPIVATGLQQLFGRIFNSTLSMLAPIL